MINIETLAPGIVRITPIGSLKAEDVDPIAPKIDAVVQKHNSIRILVDLRQFSRWDSTATFQKHASFAKAHLKNVNRIAVITSSIWQNLLVSSAKLFVRPEMRTFKDENEAKDWITEGTLLQD